MAKDDDEMTDEEMNEFERKSWKHISDQVKKSMGDCSHPNCEHCKMLKFDLKVIGDIMEAVTSNAEPSAGTTA
jgi:predicted RNA polymerase sigma factor